ncbi:MAG: phosphoesterase [Solirubrobacterales bacterium]|nr:phosphoesterase [Solirubrobacterales bacterium]
MTRARLGAIATLSVIATAFVLLDGARTSPSHAALEAALRHGVLVHAALPARATSDSGVPQRPAVAPTPVSHAAPAPTAPPSPATPSPPSGPSATTHASSPHARATPHAVAVPKPSKVKHVFVIALTGAGAQAAFGATSPAHYLATELKRRGTLLSGFRPVDGASDLPNYLAMTGGQPPNPDTRGECATFSDFPPDAATGSDGVVKGAGCLYPNTVLSIGDQLTASRHTWRAYAEDLGSGSGGVQSCRHPHPGEADDTLKARAGDQYATRHNPFVYFHSLLDLGDCMANDVALDRLSGDLRSVSTTPDYAFLAPNLCDSGTETPCVDGRPGGLASADAFLHEWVPRILGSPAYRRDGLLVITFPSSAPAPGTGTPATPAATTGPAAASPAPTGTLLLSRFARAGTTVAGPYDPYSVLRSVEDLFGLKPLARANHASSFVKAALPGAVGG